MANVCFFDMKARGIQDNVYKFLYLLQTEMEVTEESLKENLYTVRVFGQCRWNVLRGLVERANLPELSKKLSVEVEVVGMDPGYPDMPEHFYYQNGKGLVERPSDFTDYDIEEIQEIVPEIDLKDYDVFEENGEQMYRIKAEYTKDFELDLEKEVIHAPFLMS